MWIKLFIAVPLSWWIHCVWAAGKMNSLGGYSDTRNPWGQDLLEASPTWDLLTKKKKILFLFKSSFLLLAPWSSLNDTEVLLPNLPVTVLRKLQRTNSEQRFSVFINSKCMLLSCLRKESNQYIHIFFWVYVIFFHWIMNSKHFYNSKLTKWGCIKLKYINY